MPSARRRSDLSLVNMPHPQAVGGIVVDRHPGKKRVALEDHRIRRPQSLKLPNVNAAFTLAVQSGKRPQ